MYFGALRNRHLTYPLLFVFLAACGGGGGGGNNSATNTQAPAPPPDNPPPLATLNFVGATDPVDLNDQNAGAMADAMIISAITVISAADGIISSSGLAPEINEEIAGPDGGSAFVTGRVFSDGSGWLSYDLREYTDGDFVENGIDTVQWLQTGTQGDQLERRSFDNYRISSPGAGVFRLDGFVERRRAGSDETEFSGSLYYRNFGAGLELYAEDFLLSRNRATSSSSGVAFELSGTGRYFDSRFGYVDMQFETPWRLRSDVNLPVHGGPLFGFGADGRFVRAASLTREEASLGYVEAGATDISRIVRIPWDFSFELATMIPITSSPIASAGASTQHNPGREVFPDPTFSEHPDFAWLSFFWELLFKPPGSTAEFSDPTSVQPSLTLDKQGRYLVRVTASDGVNEASDYVVLTANPNGLSSDSERYVNFRLPPDTEISQGDSLAIDKTSFSPQDFRFGEPSIYLEHPAPNTRLRTASESDSQDLFETTGPGVTLLEATEGISVPLDFMLVAIDSELKYFPSVYFVPEKRADFVTVSDINGDGRDDIISTGRDNNFDSWISVHLSQAPNSFSNEIYFSGGGGHKVAIGEFTGDGRPDLVATNDPGIVIFSQQVGGGFAGPLNLSGSRCLGTEGCPLVVGDVNADNRDDVITYGDDGAVNVYLQAAGGGLTPPVTIELAGNGNETIDAAIGDLNNDGVNDIAVGISLEPTNNLAVLFGVPGNSPSIPVYFGPSTLTFKTPVVSIADLDGDSRDDLVFAYEPEGGTATIIVYLQNSAAQLEQHQLFEVDHLVLGLQLHDFDRDGRIDIGKLDEPGAMGIHYQQDDGTFGAEHREMYGQFTRPHGIGDINADGLADIVGKEFGIEIIFGTER